MFFNNIPKFIVRILVASLFISLVACSDEADEDNLVDLHIVASQDVISIEIPLALNETTLSVSSEFTFTLQGLKSNGVDLVTISRDIEWSLSQGAASSINQQGLFTAAATAENITLTAKFGLFVDSIEIRVSAAKFDRVELLHESAFNINRCQSQTLQPVGRYVEENGDVELRAVDSITIKNIEWFINEQDGSVSKRAYIDTTVDNQTILQTLASGDLVIQAKATSLVTNTDVTVSFAQEVDSNLNSIKLCLSSDTDLNNCVVTDPSVQQDSVISLMAVGNYRAADGTNFNQNITRNSQWGIDNIANASIAFSGDRQQLDVTGVTEDTTANLSVACGVIQQTLQDIDIAEGVTLDEAVSCAIDCLDSSVDIVIELLDVLSFEVSANDISLTDDVSITLDPRPDEITLVVQANLSNGDLATITDDATLTYIIIPVDNVDVIEDKTDSPGVFTVLGAGTAKVQLNYRDENFTVVIDVP